MVEAGVFDENIPCSVLLGKILVSALAEKILELGIPVLGSWALLENISGTAVGSGPGPNKYQ